MRVTIDQDLPRTAEVPDGGFGALHTPLGNLPLRAMDVRARILAMTASVQVTQEFANTFDRPLEATYIFPLPDRGAVTALRMEAAGRVVDGVLTERAKARADYDAAIAAGQRAAIAEEDRPDVFTMRVGNIVPGERVVISLAITQPLPYEDGELTFRFPLVAAPRYIPGGALDGPSAGSGTAPDTDAVPDASRISPPVLLPGLTSPVRLGISADIDPAGLRLSQLRSSLHAVTRESPDGERTQVRIEPGERLDRDFVLRMAVADASAVTGSVTLSPDPQADGPEPGTGALGSGTFLVTLVPPTPVPGDTPRDVVLVLDRSGSMSGWKMPAARRAAARIIDTLGPADRFAALCFDDRIEQAPDLAGRLVAGTDRNRFRAVEFLARTDARGGTEMLPALTLATDLLAGQGAGQWSDQRAGQGSGQAPRQRALVLVTDGQVGNEDQVLGELAPRLAGLRVHVIGIDRAVNAGFLTRLAAIGRGRCELVESQDRLDDAAARIHRRIGTPLVTGLTVRSRELRILQSTVAPGRLPDLFSGAPVLISGRFAGRCPEHAMLTVQGVAADGSPYEQTLTGIVVAPAPASTAPASTTPASTAPVSTAPASPAQASPATATWARAYLRDLEDAYASLALGSGDELTALEQQIVGASLRFGVLCRFTAFLAVDTRVVTDGGTPHRVTQPVELPSGWDGGAAPAPGVMLGAMAIPRPGMMPAAPMAAMAPSAWTGAQAGAPMGFASASAARPGAAEASAEPGLPGVPGWVVAQIVGELDWLGAPHPGPAQALVRDLADLGSRLEALVDWLVGAGIGVPGVDRLGRLATRLRACDQMEVGPGSGPGAAGARAPASDTELLGLRDEAFTVLGEFLASVQGSGSAGAERQAREPRGFWKRSPKAR